ncbi:MAG: PDZ domain-containing protein [Flavobacteriales bacterium]|nr:PDZ domain-containing protein [Flavobacteriales bacterium]
MKKIFGKRITIIAVAILISVSSYISLGFVSSYFEVSKNLDIFATLYRELNIYYVEDTDPGKLMKTAIDAMLESLDPYTVYIPESQIEDFKMMMTGQYGGIGASIQNRGDYVIITEPYENFPAHKAGLMAGDKILEIDGKPLKGKTSSEVREILLGQPNTPVKILIQRPGTEGTFEKTVIREEVKINDVPYFGMLNNETGYIKLTGFTETATKEVKTALVDLKAKQAKSIILDLRGNGGGLLNEAVNIVNLFVNKGELVVSTKGKVKEWEKEYRALNTPVDTEIPMVVLVDGGSASASEVVAGALQDLDRAIVIGQNTYGKGLVQSARPLSYNSKFKVTVSKYYVPSGRCIQRLDYSHRDDEGKVNAVPDSLRKEFTTLKNKRKVLDGAGIEPDITIEEEKPSEILQSLFSNHLLFDFATDFRIKHSSIEPAKTFRVSENEYSNFMEFLKDKEYDYTTVSEDMLEKLKEASVEEKYYASIEKEFILLKEKLSHNKNEDLILFKNEIKNFLEIEIVSRYFYQKGQVENVLSKDDCISAAFEVLGNKQKYSNILKGIEKGDKTKK